MKVVGRDKLDAFCKQHADGRRAVEAWLAEAEAAGWRTPQQIKNRYASVSFLAGNAVIFNIKGNDYRLEAIVSYRTSVVVIGWIGTHAEYDVRSRRR